MARMSALNSLIALTVLAPLAGLASDPATVPLCPEPTPPAEEAPADGAALRAYVDPDTGELVDAPPAGSRFKPDSEQTQGIASPDEDLQIVTHADGSASVELGDRFMTQLRAQVVDGKLVTCHATASQPLPRAEQESTSGEQGDEQR